MATVIQTSTVNTAAVTSTSPELNVNKKTDTIVVTTTVDNEKKMTIKQHPNDEGMCEWNRQIMKVSFNVIDNYINR